MRCVVEGRLDEVCGGWKVGGRCVVDGRLGEGVWWMEGWMTVCSGGKVG